MTTRKIARFGFAATTVLLLVAGCASQADLDALREEVAQLRASQASMTDPAAGSAAAARADAERAAASAAAAKAAADKAEQIYRQSMQK